MTRFFSPSRVRPYFPRILAIASLLLLVWLVFLPVTPKVSPWPSRDSGIFMYAGQQSLAGQALYRDVWDHKPPIIFYLNALGLVFGGGSEWGVYLLDLACLSGAVIVSYVTLRRVFGGAAAFFATASWIVALNRLIQGNQLEEYALVFQFALLFCFLEATRNTRARWPGFLVGVFAALAFFTRQNLLGLPVSVGLYWLIVAATSRQFGLAARQLLGMFAGAVVATGGILLPLLRQGVVEEMWDVGFRYNFIFSGTSWRARYDSFLFGLRLLTDSGLVFVGGSAWLMAIATGAGWARRQSPLVTIGVIGLPLELLLASLSGRDHNHYFIATLPVFAILAAYLAQQLIAGARQIEPMKQPARAAIVAGALTLSTIALPLLNVREKLVSSKAGVMPVDERALLDYIETETEPDDLVLIWGAEPAYNFFAGRRVAGQYPTIYPLYMHGYATAALLAGYVDALKQQPPALIVDVASGDDRSMPLDAASREAWLAQMDSTDGAMFGIEVTDNLDVFFDYIRQNYAIERRIGEGWEVYRPIQSEPDTE